MAIRGHYLSGVRPLIPPTDRDVRLLYFQRNDQTTHAPGLVIANDKVDRQVSRRQLDRTLQSEAQFLDLRKRLGRELSASTLMQFAHDRVLGVLGNSTKGEIDGARSLVKHAGIARERNRHVDLFLACAILVAGESHGERNPGVCQRRLQRQANFFWAVRLWSPLKREVPFRSVECRSWPVQRDLYAMKLRTCIGLPCEPEHVSANVAVAGLQYLRKWIVAAIEGFASRYRCQ